ncbi:MAG: 16S rRNA (adenine(1518)-N(6)/adenine(1519)-N(6))-dimethyltransferase RsmA [Candidatus Methanoperedens sp.]|nr:16S rRNA (adenine(1518)-N(6)/adenine(1519)-N(6))-dimethyltransferase RsmA [Candidatus Methanoperedens sp.]
MKLYKNDQHFLVDKRVLDRIIEYGDLKSCDVVLEIGAGYGNLTELLVKRAGKVIAVEMDPVLAAQIKRSHNLEIVVGDALKIDFPRFNKVISNLPYSISSPVTFKLLGCKFDFGILMYQLEFAKRMVAVPGSKDYGRLSITVQYYADVEILEVVPPGAFSAPPEVSSAIVKLIPHPPPYIVKDETFFMRFLIAVFSQRRKTIKNAIVNNSGLLGIKDNAIGAISDEILRKRAEVLSPRELAELADILYDVKI